MTDRPTNRRTYWLKGKFYFQLRPDTSCNHLFHRSELWSPNLGQGRLHRGLKLPGQLCLRQQGKVPLQPRYTSLCLLVCLSVYLSVSLSLSRCISIIILLQPEKMILKPEIIFIYSPHRYILSSIDRVFEKCVFFQNLIILFLLKM